MGLGFDIRLWYTPDAIAPDQLALALRDFDSRMALERVSLAAWSSYGFKFFKELVASGRGEIILDGGYPILYAVDADAVVPFLTEGGVSTLEAGLETTSGFATHHKVVLRDEAIVACPAGATLYFEAWDQS